MDHPAFAPTPHYLSIDLEVDRRTAHIHKLAAVRGDTGQALVCGKGGNLQATLARLDAFTSGLRFLLGHNLIAFDLPHLIAVKPDLAILRLPAVDTLRLNPLAFPRNPYHHLVKHYQDGQLKRGRINDPELDARLALEVFADQCTAFLVLNENQRDLLLAWHWLTTQDENAPALNGFFTSVRRAPRPSDAEAHTAIEHFLSGRGCLTHARAVLVEVASHGWALAYAMAWLSVAGGNSVMPPWVRHQFPEAGILVRRLRDTPCTDPTCPWCSERHDAQRELKRWFGFGAFRAEPAGADGRSLQQAIVTAAMAGEHVLAILPTGTGKSLCYQIPALSRYDKTGALTVVISPLVALMADQVAGLMARGIVCCAALNGLLSLPERSDVLDRVRLGDIGILLVSPEQLRNRSFRTVLAQREIGAWVLDEAHCLSKWGHDFRPDYRYVGRFIRERAGDGPVPPVLCLTATAKPEVVMDILSYFQAKVGIELRLFDGGAQRTNLDFAVVSTTPAEKFAHLYQVIEHYLPPEQPGGAIVYCATRRRTEEVAVFLHDKGLTANYFHAGLPPEAKKDVQERFTRGELRVIAATNAFGMGIDKPDVRLVVHIDIPGSLENYLQEAGRAGRDRDLAQCVLLYCAEDVEWQFSMSARSRLNQQEIQAILRALRRLERRKRGGGEVIATSGEILVEEDQGAFDRDSVTDDTRVRTALSWLEESALLTREENQVQVFPSSLRVGSLEEARKRLATVGNEEYRRQLLSLVDSLLDANPDEGISTDELMGRSGLNAEGVRKALHDLEQLGIAANDTALTAFVHAGVERSSRKRYEEVVALETALIDLLRESASELGKGDTSVLHLRHATQQLKDAGHPHALPEQVWRLVHSLSFDGRNEEGGRGSIGLRRLDPETVQVTLQREWNALQETARRRREAASRLLDHLLASLPNGQRGTDLLAETTFGKLRAVLDQDLLMRTSIKDPQKLLERALLWLHEQEVIRLNKGLAVFRSAMTIRLTPERRGFLKADFEPLAGHYQEQVLQIHVMAHYAERALKAMADAVRLAMDYFRLSREEFLQRWLPGREKELARQTTPSSWRTIVEALNNPVQQRIVTDDRELANVLVLAGPGAGKTRVLVHRIAWLVRVRREDPHTILALAYNRHAAVAIRRRLAVLIGDDARGITVLTCHALAMRLVGASFAGRTAQEGQFREILAQAVALLAGNGLLPEEADAQRERLLTGFRWILVDEYQDIGPEQYALIAALAGRTLRDEERRLSLFAVGDDDQNIYAFNGASVEFIRRFETDYTASATYLTENYRSTAHIIGAANRVIAPAVGRMKADHPITIDRARRKAPAGGRWEALDPVARGRVQVLPTLGGVVGQAVAIMAELQRLASLDPSWNWSQAAVIGREWRYLEPVRAWCEHHALPVQMADEEPPPFWRLRETVRLVEWLRTLPSRLMDGPGLTAWLAQRGGGPWWELLGQALEEYIIETGGAELPCGYVIEWLAEWGREVRRRQNGLLLLSAHRAKGLEFDHVAVLDGGWTRRDSSEDVDAMRRLYYVAMTRARETLTLVHMEGHHPFLDADNPLFLHRAPLDHGPPDPSLSRRYRRLTPKEVDVGFAGRYADSHSVHATIAALRPGDGLQLVAEGERWCLRNQAGVLVGRLAKSFLPPAGMVCVEARVVAILTWRREDNSEPEYLHVVRCGQWEVVLPELVFAADSH
ncbi:ATP-dependent DNA helicase RecQ [Gammaproteobacteria bacterium]